MTVLTDQETLNNRVMVGGVEDFCRDLEFRRLNPPFSTAEFADLGAFLVAKGRVKDAFFVCQGQPLILDGYFRTAICERLSKSFTTRLVSLPDREIPQAHNH